MRGKKARWFRGCRNFSPSEKQKETAFKYFILRRDATESALAWTDDLRAEKMGLSKTEVAKSPRTKDTATAAKRRVNSANKTITPRTKVIVRKPCQYRDPITGKICASTYMLHVDHIQPKALGGGNEEGNLRSLCAQHNRLMAHQHGLLI